jgi:GTP:adenosylcobinamide-phosphate guanylyltransferase
MIHAAVLAAGPCDGGFAERSGLPHKCMVSVGGRPMLAWVLDALRGARTIGGIAVVGRPPLLRDAGAHECEILPLERARFVESLRAAIEYLRDEERALVLAADMPLLTSEAVDRYVETCLGQSADLCFPVIRREELHALYPGARKTWYNLRDGAFAKGNAVLARPAFLARRGGRLQTLFDHRKHRRWTGLLGPAFVRRLAQRALTLHDMQEGLSWYLGGMLQAVPADPEIIIDVDEPADVGFAEEALVQRDRHEDRVLHRGV